MYEYMSNVTLDEETSHNQSFQNLESEDAKKSKY